MKRIAILAVTHKVMFDDIVMTAAMNVMMIMMIIRR